MARSLGRGACRPAADGVVWRRPRRLTAARESQAELDGQEMQSALVSHSGLCSSNSEFLTASLQMTAILNKFLIRFTSGLTWSRPGVDIV